MKLHVLLSAVLATQTSAAPVSSEEEFSEANILRTLLLNPQRFPESSHTLLVNRVNAFAKSSTEKRSPQATLSPWLSSVVSPGLLAGTLDIGKAALQEAAKVLLRLPPDPRAPKTTVREIQQVEVARNWTAMGGKAVKVRYGPYRIPPISEKNAAAMLLDQRGMGDTVTLATKPCENCTLLQIDASLENADGSPAENDDGTWFHHAVLVNFSPQAREVSCSNYLPYETLMMSGNEKMPVFFAVENATVKSGYYLGPKDNFILNTQLMNKQDREKWAWITIVYQYLDGEQPGWQSGKNMWDSLSSTTIGVCPSSKVNPYGKTNLTADQQPLRDDFLYEYSTPWTAPADGLILATGGHMHDGGIDIEIFQNDKVICSSVATYAAGPSSHGGMGGGSGNGTHSDMEMNEHIAHQSRCQFNKEPLPIKKGDKVSLKANYDFRVHPGMRNAKGELDELMGIVDTLVAYPKA